MRRRRRRRRRTRRNEDEEEEEAEEAEDGVSEERAERRETREQSAARYLTDESGEGRGRAECELLLVFGQYQPGQQPRGHACDPVGRHCRVSPCCECCSAFLKWELRECVSRLAAK